MSRFVVAVILFILAEVIGVLLGEWFFHLFLKAVPPVALSDFNTQSSRIAHWMYGAGVGLVLFAFALLGMITSRIMRHASRPAATS
jgi:uncharacterized membrane protein